MADPGEALLLDQTKAQRVEKKKFLRPPSPLMSQGLDDPVDNGWMTTLHVLSHAFVHFSAETSEYDVKLPNFTFHGGRERKTFLFFF